MEEEIRELRKDIKEMSAQLSSVQTMLSGSVLDELAVVRKRLDKHSATAWTLWNEHSTRC